MIQTARRVSARQVHRPALRGTFLGCLVLLSLLLTLSSVAPPSAATAALSVKSHSIPRFVERKTSVAWGTIGVITAAAKPFTTPPDAVILLCVETGNYATYYRTLAMKSCYKRQAEYAAYAASQSSASSDSSNQSSSDSPAAEIPTPVICDVELSYDNVSSTAGVAAAISKIHRYVSMRRSEAFGKNVRFPSPAAARVASNASVLQREDDPITPKFPEATVEAPNRIPAATSDEDAFLSVTLLTIDMVFTHLLPHFGPESPHNVNLVSMEPGDLTSPLLSSPSVGALSQNSDVIGFLIGSTLGNVTRTRRIAYIQKSPIGDSSHRIQKGFVNGLFKTCPTCRLHYYQRPFGADEAQWAFETIRLMERHRVDSAWGDATSLVAIAGLWTSDLLDTETGLDWLPRRRCLGGVDVPSKKLQLYFKRVLSKFDALPTMADLTLPGALQYVTDPSIHGRGSFANDIIVTFTLINETLDAHRLNATLSGRPVPSDAQLLAAVLPAFRMTMPEYEHLLYLHSLITRLKLNTSAPLIGEPGYVPSYVAALGRAPLTEAAYYPGNSRAAVPDTVKAPEAVAYASAEVSKANVSVSYDSGVTIRNTFREVLELTATEAFVPLTIVKDPRGRRSRFPGVFWDAFFGLEEQILGRNFTEDEVTNIASHTIPGKETLDVSADAYVCYYRPFVTGLLFNTRNPKFIVLYSTMGVYSTVADVYGCKGSAEAGGHTALQAPDVGSSTSAASNTTATPSASDVASPPFAFHEKVRFFSDRYPVVPRQYRRFSIQPAQPKVAADDSSESSSAAAPTTPAPASTPGPQVEPSVLLNDIGLEDNDETYHALLPAARIESGVAGPVGTGDTDMALLMMGRSVDSSTPIADAWVLEMNRTTPHAVLWRKVWAAADPKPFDAPPEPSARYGQCTVFAPKMPGMPAGRTGAVVHGGRFNTWAVSDEVWGFQFDPSLRRGSWSRLSSAGVSPRGGHSCIDLGFTTLTQTVMDRHGVYTTDAMWLFSAFGTRATGSPVVEGYAVMSQRAVHLPDPRWPSGRTVDFADTTNGCVSAWTPFLWVMAETTASVDDVAATEEDLQVWLGETDYANYRSQLQRRRSNASDSVNDTSDVEAEATVEGSSAFSTTKQRPVLVICKFVLSRSELGWRCRPRPVFSGPLHRCYLTGFTLGRYGFLAYIGHDPTAFGEPRTLGGRIVSDVSAKKEDLSARGVEQQAAPSSDSSPDTTLESDRSVEYTEAENALLRKGGRGDMNQELVDIVVNCSLDLNVVPDEFLWRCVPCPSGTFASKVVASSSTTDPYAQSLSGFACMPCTEGAEKRDPVAVKFCSSSTVNFTLIVLLVFAAAAAIGVTLALLAHRTRLSVQRATAAEEAVELVVHAVATGDFHNARTYLDKTHIGVSREMRRSLGSFLQITGLFTQFIPEWVFTADQPGLAPAHGPKSLPGPLPQTTSAMSPSPSTSPTATPTGGVPRDIDLSLSQSQRSAFDVSLSSHQKLPTSPTDAAAGSSSTSLRPAGASVSGDSAAGKPQGRSPKDPDVADGNSAPLVNSLSGTHSGSGGGSRRSSEGIGIDGRHRGSGAGRSPVPSSELPPTAAPEAGLLGGLRAWLTKPKPEADVDPNTGSCIGASGAPQKTSDNESLIGAGNSGLSGSTRRDRLPVARILTPPPPPLRPSESELEVMAELDEQKSDTALLKAVEAESQKPPRPPGRASPPPAARVSPRPSTQYLHAHAASSLTSSAGRDSTSESDDALKRRLGDSHRTSGDASPEFLSPDEPAAAGRARKRSVDTLGSNTSGRTTPRLAVARPRSSKHYRRLGSAVNGQFGGDVSRGSSRGEDPGASGSLGGSTLRRRKSSGTRRYDTAGNPINVNGEDDDVDRARLITHSASTAYGRALLADAERKKRKNVASLDEEPHGQTEREARDLAERRREAELLGHRERVRSNFLTTCDVTVVCVVLRRVDSPFTAAAAAQEAAEQALAHADTKGNSQAPSIAGAGWSRTSAQNLPAPQSIPHTSSSNSTPNVASAADHSYRSGSSANALLSVPGEGTGGSHSAHSSAHSSGHHARQSSANGQYLHPRSAGASPFMQTALGNSGVSQPSGAATPCGGATPAGQTPIMSVQPRHESTSTSTGTATSFKSDTPGNRHLGTARQTPHTSFRGLPDKSPLMVDTTQVGTHGAPLVHLTPTSGGVGGGVSPVGGNSAGSHILPAAASSGVHGGGGSFSGMQSPVVAGADHGHVPSQYPSAVPSSVGSARTPPHGSTVPVISAALPPVAAVPVGPIGRPPIAVSPRRTESTRSTGPPAPGSATTATASHRERTTPMTPATQCSSGTPATADTTSSGHVVTFPSFDGKRRLSSTVAADASSEEPSAGGRTGSVFAGLGTGPSAGTGESSGGTSSSPLSRLVSPLTEKTNSAASGNRPLASVMSGSDLATPPNAAELNETRSCVQLSCHANAILAEGPPPPIQSSDVVDEDSRNSASLPLAREEIDHEESDAPGEHEAPREAESAAPAPFDHSLAAHHSPPPPATSAAPVVPLDAAVPNDSVRANAAQESLRASHSAIGGRSSGSASTHGTSSGAAPGSASNGSAVSPAAGLISIHPPGAESVGPQLPLLAAPGANVGSVHGTLSGGSERLQPHLQPYSPLTPVHLGSDLGSSGHVAGQGRGSPATLGLSGMMQRQPSYGFPVFATSASDVPAGYHGHSMTSGPSFGGAHHQGHGHNVLESSSAVYQQQAASPPRVSISMQPQPQDRRLSAPPVVVPARPHALVNMKENAAWLASLGRSGAGESSANAVNSSLARSVFYGASVFAGVPLDPTDRVPGNNSDTGAVGLGSGDASMAGSPVQAAQLAALNYGVGTQMPGRKRPGPGGDGTPASPDPTGRGRPSGEASPKGGKDQKARKKYDPTPLLHVTQDPLRSDIPVDALNRFHQALSSVAKAHEGCYVECVLGDTAFLVFNGLSHSFNPGAAAGAAAATLSNAPVWPGMSMFCGIAGGPAKVGVITGTFGAHSVVLGDCMTKASALARCAFALGPTVGTELLQDAFTPFEEDRSFRAQSSSSSRPPPHPNSSHPKLPSQGGHASVPRRHYFAKLRQQQQFLHSLLHIPGRALCDWALKDEVKDSVVLRLVGHLPQCLVAEIAGARLRYNCPEAVGIPLPLAWRSSGSRMLRQYSVSMLQTVMLVRVALSARHDEAVAKLKERLREGMVSAPGPMPLGASMYWGSTLHSPAAGNRGPIVAGLGFSTTGHIPGADISHNGYFGESTASEAMMLGGHSGLYTDDPENFVWSESVIQSSESFVVPQVGQASSSGHLEAGPVGIMAGSATGSNHRHGSQLSVPPQLSGGRDAALGGPLAASMSLSNNSRSGSPPAIPALRHNAGGDLGALPSPMATSTLASSPTKLDGHSRPPLASALQMPIVTPMSRRGSTASRAPALPGLYPFQDPKGGRRGGRHRRNDTLDDDDNPESVEDEEVDDDLIVDVVGDDIGRHRRLSTSGRGRAQAPSEKDRKGDGSDTPPDSARSVGSGRGAVRERHRTAERTAGDSSGGGSDATTAEAAAAKKRRTAAQEELLQKRRRARAAAKNGREDYGVPPTYNGPDLTLQNDLLEAEFRGDVDRQTMLRSHMAWHAGVQMSPSATHIKTPPGAQSPRVGSGTHLSPGLSHAMAKGNASRSWHSGDADIDVGAMGSHLGSFQLPNPCLPNGSSSGGHSGHRHSANDLSAQGSGHLSPRRKFDDGTLPVPRVGAGHTSSPPRAGRRGSGVYGGMSGFNTPSFTASPAEADALGTHSFRGTELPGAVPSARPPAHRRQSMGSPLEAKHVTSTTGGSTGPGSVPLSRAGTQILGSAASAAPLMDHRTLSSLPDLSRGAALSSPSAVPVGLASLGSESLDRRRSASTAAPTPALVGLASPSGGPALPLAFARAASGTMSPQTPVSQGGWNNSFEPDRHFSAVSSPTGPADITLRRRVSSPFIDGARRPPPLHPTTVGSGGSTGAVSPAAGSLAESPGHGSRSVGSASGSGAPSSWSPSAPPHQVSPGRLPPSVPLSLPQYQHPGVSPQIRQLSGEPIRPSSRGSSGRESSLPPRRTSPQVSVGTSSTQSEAARSPGRQGNLSDLPLVPSPRGPGPATPPVQTPGMVSFDNGSTPARQHPDASTSSLPRLPNVFGAPAPGATASVGYSLPYPFSVAGSLSQHPGACSGGPGLLQDTALPSPSSTVHVGLGSHTQHSAVIAAGALSSVGVRPTSGGSVRSGNGTTSSFPAGAETAHEDRAGALKSTQEAKGSTTTHPSGLGASQHTLHPHSSDNATALQSSEDNTADSGNRSRQHSSLVPQVELSPFPLSHHRSSQDTVAGVSLSGGGFLTAAAGVSPGASSSAYPPGRIRGGSGSGTTAIFSESASTGRPPPAFGSCATTARPAGENYVHAGGLTSAADAAALMSSSHASHNASLHSMATARLPPRPPSATTPLTGAARPLRSPAEMGLDVNPPRRAVPAGSRAGRIGDSATPPSSPSAPPTPQSQSPASSHLPASAEHTAAYGRLALSMETAGSQRHDGELSTLGGSSRPSSSLPLNSTLSTVVASGTNGGPRPSSAAAGSQPQTTSSMRPHSAQGSSLMQLGAMTSSLLSASDNSRAGGGTGGLPVSRFQNAPNPQQHLADVSGNAPSSEDATPITHVESGVTPVVSGVFAGSLMEHSNLEKSGSARAQGGPQNAQRPPAVPAIVGPPNLPHPSPQSPTTQSSSRGGQSSRSSPHVLSGGSPQGYSNSLPQSGSASGATPLSNASSGPRLPAPGQASGTGDGGTGEGTQSHDSRGPLLSLVGSVGSSNAHPPASPTAHPQQAPPSVPTVPVSHDSAHPAHRAVRDPVSLRLRKQRQ